MLQIVLKKKNLKEPAIWKQKQQYIIMYYTKNTKKNKPRECEVVSFFYNFHFSFSFLHKHNSVELS